MAAGLASGALIELNPMDVLLRNYGAVGVAATGKTAEEAAAAWAALADLADRTAVATSPGFRSTT